MSYETTLQAAYQELQEKQVKGINPPLYLLLRRLGFKIRPPHYQSPLHHFLANLVLVAIIVFIIEYLMSTPPFDLPHAIRYALELGGIVGLISAYHMHTLVKKLHLTKWENLPG